MTSTTMSLARRISIRLACGRPGLSLRHTSTSLTLQHVPLTLQSLPTNISTPARCQAAQRLSRRHLSFPNT
ncbi:hypothetical protein VTJ04DRAFT_9688 [Mycothermus thermophilus]|uniref:uncharacterized protein n=1 Tax=Humicola insolens TaxID=85995 RepID=UPI0037425FB7